jgi:hypothetical protein
MQRPQLPLGVSRELQKVKTFVLIPHGFVLAADSGPIIHLHRQS